MSDHAGSTPARSRRRLALDLIGSLLIAALFVWLITTDDDRFSDGGQSFGTVAIAVGAAWNLGRAWREARALRTAYRGGA